ncbi:MAG: hypothetical protein JSV97_01700 [candidate division WOR-3 bacterium]|nr:MAG: hypothetical protein JSV97_01700 [candidate division WOR-3 bacterium]
MCLGRRKGINHKAQKKLLGHYRTKKRLREYGYDPVLCVAIKAISGEHFGARCLSDEEANVLECAMLKRFGGRVPTGYQTAWELYRIEHENARDDHILNYQTSK